ncbi:protein of unknown function [Kyrpidia spormannii]|uniref:Uncharacterized protein n=2 Tax=Kyrpidia spormannii TaxID=2055160 RepID=A0A6F9EB77_9BACL|nr:protein of unknown function [Kyrpidia spormannii]CAB3394588.1 protein of unknown function [Kyrpidia spormannii]
MRRQLDTVKKNTGNDGDRKTRSSKAQRVGVGESPAFISDVQLTPEPLAERLPLRGRYQ